jgi:hypothetical protein
MNPGTPHPIVQMIMEMKKKQLVVVFASTECGWCNKLVEETLPLYKVSLPDLPELIVLNDKPENIFGVTRGIAEIPSFADRKVMEEIDSFPCTVIFSEDDKELRAMSFAGFKEYKEWSQNVSQLAQKLIPHVSTPMASPRHARVIVVGQPDCSRIYRMQDEVDSLRGLADVEFIVKSEALQEAARIMKENDIPGVLDGLPITFVFPQAGPAQIFTGIDEGGWNVLVRSMLNKN